MIDFDLLARDRDFLSSLEIDFEGLEDDRVLRILEALRVSNRNAGRWRSIAEDLFADVARLRVQMDAAAAVHKQVTITLPDGR